MLAASGPMGCWVFGKSFSHNRRLATNSLMVLGRLAGFSNLAVRSLSSTLSIHNSNLTIPLELLSAYDHFYRSGLFEFNQILFKIKRKLVVFMRVLVHALSTPSSNTGVNAAVIAPFSLGQSSTPAPADTSGNSKRKRAAEDKSTERGSKSKKARGAENAPPTAGNGDPVKKPRKKRSDAGQPKGPRRARTGAGSTA
ncbi:hypothetical protein B0H16DRAFT_1467139 [Mycena metata]|uniref:Uncharacterized protein n=1 Tax=Mycena metata TaxID=1033252 RepID=A0AAD7I5L7_9AGAR|nr:hypothetical protein B0H16DRAFT_1467139 [Mycena metata]